jgi:hypothetical protein
MKKLIFIILLLSGSIFGQTINWSDVSVNYPITKDDSASVLYATARVDTVKAIHINKILRMIRLLQDKVGLGGNYTLAANRVLKVNAGGDSTYWGTDATGAGGSAYADSLMHDSRTVPGDSFITDAEGNSRFLLLTLFDDSLGLGVKTQAYDLDLADLADGSLTASKVAGVADADYGDITVATGVWSVEDNSHSHTTYLVLSAFDDSVANYLTDAHIPNSITVSNYLLLTAFDDSITANESRLEGLLDLNQLQGSVTDGQVPNDITASNYLLLTVFDDSLSSPSSDEIIQDLIGAMLSGNTETNIAVTYQDGDGTIDFEVSGLLLLTAFDDSLGLGTKTQARSAKLDSISSAGNWKVYYTNGSGVIQKLALGANGTVLKSNGATSAPSWQTDATGAGGAAYADSITHDGRHIPGDSVITDAEGAARFQPLEATLTDIADGTIAENLVNTANPWADNEVADNITASSYLLLTLFDDSLTANESRLEGLLDLDQLQGTIGDAQIAAGAVDGGVAGEIQDSSIVGVDIGSNSIGAVHIAAGAVGSSEIATNAVSADELDEAGVEAGLEAVLDLQDLQGAVTDGQVPDGLTASNYLLRADFTDSLISTDGDENIADFIGTMVTGNTETNITVTYQDADNTLDFVVSAGSADSVYKSVAVDTFKAKTDTIRVIDPVKLESGSGIYGLQTVDLDSGIFNILSLDNHDYGDITWNGTTVNIDAGTVGTNEIATDGVSADELNATGVESELEAVLDLAQLQGELTPDNIQSAGQVDEYVLSYEATGDSLQWVAMAGGGDMLAAAFDDSLANPVADEIISDFVGTMLTGNTETDITVTYQDADNTIDFVVALGQLPASGTNPTTDAAGEISVDTDDDAVEFYSSASRIISARQIGNYTILFPDSVRSRTDDVVFAHFPAEIFPFGVTIFYIAISTNPASSDTHVIEEWSDVVGTGQGTTESLTLSAANKVESSSIDDGAIDADDYLNINLDDATDNIHELIITVGYYVNPGD